MAKCQCLLNARFRHAGIGLDSPFMPLQQLSRSQCGAASGLRLKSQSSLSFTADRSTKPQQHKQRSLPAMFCLMARLLRTGTTPSAKPGRMSPKGVYDLALYLGLASCLLFRSMPASLALYTGWPPWCSIIPINSSRQLQYLPLPHTPFPESSQIMRYNANPSPSPNPNPNASPSLASYFVVLETRPAGAGAWAWAWACLVFPS